MLIKLKKTDMFMVFFKLHVLIQGKCNRCSSSLKPDSDNQLQNQQYLPSITLLNIKRKLVHIFFFNLRIIIFQQ